MFRNPFRKKKKIIGWSEAFGKPSMNLKTYDRMRKINRLLGRIELTNSTGLIQMKQDYWF
jgi:hypothetical protein